MIILLEVNLFNVWLKWYNVADFAPLMPSESPQPWFNNKSSTVSCVCTEVIVVMQFIVYG